MLPYGTASLRIVWDANVYANYGCPAQRQLREGHSMDAMRPTFRSFGQPPPLSNLVCIPICLCRLITCFLLRCVCADMAGLLYDVLHSDNAERAVIVGQHSAYLQPDWCRDVAVS